MLNSRRRVALHGVIQSARVPTRQFVDVIDLNSKRRENSKRKRKIPPRYM